MSKVSCEIIKDLLPLYYDEVCSSESKKMVAEHLAGCNSCKSELDIIRTDIKIPKETVEKNRSDGNVIKGIADFWKRSKVKAFIKGLIGATLLFMVIFLGYIGLFRWNIISVPTDVVEITDVSKLADGRIAYHVKLTDGYDLNECRYNIDKDGNFYITPLRPIVKTKAQALYGLANGYDFFDVEGQERNRNGAEINTLYYGTPKDNILIWEKGMELPEASETVKALLEPEPQPELQPELQAKPQPEPQPVKQGTTSDEVQVNVIAEFTVNPISVEGNNWFTDIAGGLDKPLKIIYGKLKLIKMGSQVTIDHDFIKISGENGSQRFLVNSGGTGWYDEGTYKKLKYLKLLFWSAKRLEGNTLVKDFSLPIYSVVLKKNFDENQKLTSIDVFFSSEGQKSNEQFWSGVDPVTNVYQADMSTLRYEGDPKAR